MIWGDNFLRISYHHFCTPELHLFSRQDLKVSSTGGKTESPHNFSIRILIMSCPWIYLDQGFSLFCQYRF